MAAAVVQLPTDLQGLRSDSGSARAGLRTRKYPALPPGPSRLPSQQAAERRSSSGPFSISK
eukprot:750740-Hanusia_phi.AAC.1